jgi:signal transduction histidine kinase
MNLSRAMRSTTWHLAVAVCLAFLFGFILLGGAVYGAVSTLLLRDAREAVVAEADGLRDTFRDGGRAALAVAVRDRITQPDEPDALHALWIDGRPVASDMPPNSVPARDGWRQANEADDTRVLVVRRTLAPGVVVATGLRLRSESGFLAMMARTTLAALVIAALLGLAIGALTARWVSRRLQALDDTAARVGEGEIVLRAPVDGTGDAFDRLAMRFNAMLDRIEALVAGVSEATDHIAHDLRTPLTRLRTRLDTLRMQGTVTPEALEPAIADADQLLHASGALLRLARIEAQARIEQESAVDLAKLASDALELYEPIAAEREIAFVADTTVLLVRGDADQLFQLLVNLLDNAVKFAPPASRVAVEVHRKGGHACLVVADRGPGIPAHERDRIFDRFQRLETHRGTPGSGLGLSLVRAIALRHHARIALEDNHPGLRAVVSLPLAPAGAPGEPQDPPPMR